MRHPGQTAAAALPWEEGGLALVDIDLQRECLLAKVAARLLQTSRALELCYLDRRRRRTGLLGRQTQAAAGGTSRRRL